MSKWGGVLFILFVFLTSVYACSGDDSEDGDDDGAEGEGEGEASNTWLKVNDFLYQLQYLDFEEAGNSKFDLVVTDYSADGSDEARYTLAEITGLQNSPGGKKLVLAYMSIGEAETYRWYWNPAWDADEDGDPDNGAPVWLGPENEDWEGNYKVKYWDEEWQGIILSYLDKIISAGFDGVYLDIIDAYEYWGPEGESGLERETAAKEMSEFVIKIARYARETKGRSDFGVFPQNGEALAFDFDGYVATVTGIGREDVWYNENDKESEEHTNEALEALDIFRNAGKLVLVIDYVTEKSKIADFYTKARAKGYVPYATTRELDKMTVNEGFEPD